MRRSRRPGPALWDAGVSLALGGLLLWKPQIFVSALLFVTELAQKAVTPAIMSLAH
ncbi:MAG TPA: hypothetical protein VIK32_08635 [Candidatus Limnocylindrales bacterium]